MTLGKRCFARSLVRVIADVRLHIQPPWLRSGNYRTVIVETFYPSDTSGRHGPVHVRPAKRQVFPQDLFVECSKDLIDTKRFPVGTKFRLSAKLTDREGGTPFLYSYYGWGYEVVSDEEFERLFPDPERSAI